MCGSLIVPVLNLDSVHSRFWREMTRRDGSTPDSEVTPGHSPTSEVRDFPAPETEGSFLGHQDGSGSPSRVKERRVTSDEPEESGLPGSLSPARSPVRPGPPREKGRGETPGVFDSVHSPTTKR